MLDNLSPTTTFYLGIVASFVVSIIANYLFSNNLRTQVQKIQNLYAKRSVKTSGKRLRKLQFELSEAENFIDKPADFYLFLWEALFIGLRGIVFGVIIWASVDVIYGDRLPSSLVLIGVFYYVLLTYMQAVRVISRCRNFQAYKNETIKQIDLLEERIGGVKNLEGTWQGEFCGDQKGTLTISQKEHELSATLTTSCNTDGEFEAIQELLKGEIRGNKVRLTGTKVHNTDKGSQPNYFLDDFDLTLSNDGNSLDGIVTDLSNSRIATQFGAKFCRS